MLFPTLMSVWRLCGISNPNDSSNEALHEYESMIWFSAQVAAPDSGRPGCTATTLTDNAAFTATPPVQPRLAAEARLIYSISQMVSKRYSRGVRQIDSDTHLDSPTRRDNMFGQPRLPLVAAAFLVFVAGTFVGMRYCRCRLSL